MIAYMAPLEGITTYIYRNAYHRHFHPLDKYFTPFIVPAEKRPLRTRERRDTDPANNRDLPVVPQILTNSASGFLETAEALGDLGYKEVNLNLGCPSGTVTSRGKGAGFLRSPVDLDRFLEEVFDRCRQDVSLKVRLGWSDPSEIEDLLPIYNRYPLKELILHPRVRQEFYRGEVHMEAYLAALRQLHCPVIYNGNLFRVEDIRGVCEEAPETAGVMIGRGLISQPGIWSAACGDAVSMKDLETFHAEVYRGYRESLSGDDPVIHKMKEIWTYMIQGVTGRERYEKRFRKVHRRLEYEELAARVFAEEKLCFDGFLPPDGWQIRGQRQSRNYL